MNQNPMLRKLDALVGEWEMRASIGGQTVASGRSTLSWLEGGAFVRQHTEADPPGPDTPASWVEGSPMPVTTIIGLDDTAETFSMLYADARGVYRVYAMTFADNLWTLHRAAPGFHQRFTGTLSDDGKTITARWEGSPDGTSWTLDFNLTYTRLA